MINMRIRAVDKVDEVAITMAPHIHRRCYSSFCTHMELDIMRRNELNHVHSNLLMIQIMSSTQK